MIPPEYAKKKKKKMKQPNTLYQATLFWQQQSTLKDMTKYMHICLAKNYEFLENVSKWYNYNPEPQFDTDLAKILQNLPVQTDRGINYNKSDILVLDKNTRTILIIDIAIPYDVNISRKRNKVTNDANLVKRAMGCLLCEDCPNYN